MQKKIPDEDERRQLVLMEERQAAEDRIKEQQIIMEWPVEGGERKAAVKQAAKNARRVKKAVEASKAKAQLTPEESLTLADSSDTESE